MNEITERSMEESPVRPVDLTVKMRESGVDPEKVEPEIENEEEEEQDPNRINLMNQVTPV